MKHWGNDIVALNDLQFKGRLQDWIRKVCTDQEKDWLYASDDIHLARWRLWSCKESAYKVLLKCGISPFMNAKRIVVYSEESITAAAMHFKVKFDRQELWGYSLQNGYWVYSICCNLPFNDKEYHCRIVFGPEAGSSERIRSELKLNLEKEHGIKVEKIDQSDQDIPVIHCQDSQVKIDLSLTHHAPYSAYLYHIRPLI